MIGSAAQGQIVVYGFGSTGSPTNSATSVASSITASVFSGNLGTPGTGGTSPLYTAGSGGSYFTASTWTASAPGTNYFEFTLTPNAGHEFSITTLSFGYRATSTGPTAFAVRSSSDSYAANLASGALIGDSTWRPSGTQSITLSGLNTSTTIRIFGSGASSSLGTFRIDDVTVAGSVAAIPEPATYVAIVGVVTLVGVAIRRRRLQRAA